MSSGANQQGRKSVDFKSGKIMRQKVEELSAKSKGDLGTN